MAEFAGGDAGEGGQLAPAERGPHHGEFLADRVVILFGVESAVFAGREPQQQIECEIRIATQFAVARNRGRRVELIFRANGGLGFTQQTFRLSYVTPGESRLLWESQEPGWELAGTIGAPLAADLPAFTPMQ